MNFGTMAAAWVVGAAWGAPAAPNMMLGVSPPGQGCPAPTPGWVLSPLRPEPLERFCEYIRSSTSGPQPMTIEGGEPSTCTEPGTCGVVEGLVDGQIGRVKPQSGDAAQLSSATEGWDTHVSAAMAGTLWTHFLRQVGAPPTPLASTSAPRARVALVDTLSSLSRSPASRHGPTLKALAERLGRRTSGALALEVVPHLGLPRTAQGGTDYIDGGHYGTLWDLAQAIAAAATEAQVAGQSRLVLNLSLGWDPTGQPSLPSAHIPLIHGTSNLPAPMRAVHAALVYARCSGALIYAASGNDDLGLQDRSGLLLPAAWTDRSAPTASECGGLWAGSAVVGAKPGAPLVYAVGGIGNDDQRLPNARPNSTPVLVAAAEGVPPPTPGRILTGTSVATLLASTTAALVWGIEPQASADDVHTRLEQSARPLPWLAEQCSGRRICPAARSLDVCAAQRSACQASSGAGCLPAYCPSPGGHTWPTSMFVAGGFAALSNGGRLLPVTYGPERPTAKCENVRMPQVQLGPKSPCPTDEVVAARNLDASPQPVDPMCPACFVDITPLSVTLVVDIVPSVPGGLLHEPFVMVRDVLGREAKYALPGPLQEGFSGAFQLMPGVGNVPVAETWLQYQLNAPGGPFSVAEPLFTH